MKQPSMKVMRWMLPLCLVASVAEAQLYKSVGPDGKVTYSDTPPVNQKIVETKSLSPSQDVTNFPYELKLAASKNPVVLYTTTNCKPCVDGKSFLKSAGVPFAEKSVKSNADTDKLKQISGDIELPFLTVGNNKLHGFNQSEWKAAISNAGYPESNRLPATYSYPQPESLAPVAKPDPAPPKPVVTPTPAPVKKPENDNGFRF
ncbi:glutaredoxin family protein [Undibacterium sp. MH2W]|uniref:glutaredoxin family protein n=1 Tax=Undibacterium sp. MH2W TaxID=3413044 RepID=UPI003BF43582